MNKENLNETIMSEWDSAMRMDEIPSLKKNVNQMMKIMTDGLFKQSYENLHILFQAGSKKIEAWGNRLNIHENEKDSKIFSYAVFWMAEKISENLYNKWISKEKTKEQYEEIKAMQNTKHLYEILELLEHNGEMTQGAMACKLSMSTNALSNCLRRYDKFKLWEFVKVGKWSFYHLTVNGKKCLNLFKQKKCQEEYGLQTLLTDSINMLAEELEKAEPDMDHVVHRINQKFGGTQSVFGDRDDKIALYRAMRKLSDNARRREVKRMVNVKRISISKKTVPDWKSDVLYWELSDPESIFYFNGGIIDESSRNRQRYQSADFEFTQGYH